MKGSNVQNYPVALFVFLSLWGFSCPAFAQIQPNRPTFFEDGYRQLNREVQRLENTAPSEPVLTVDTGELRWQRMISRRGGFSLWMPAGIYTDEVRSVSILDENLEFEVVSTNQPNSRFVVAYSGVLPAAFLDNSGEVFEQILDRVVADTNFRVTGDPSPVGAENSVYSAILTDETERIYLQMYLINNRVYVLGVNEKTASDLSQAGQYFFESFQFF